VFKYTRFDDTLQHDARSLVRRPRLHSRDPPRRESSTPDALFRDSSRALRSGRRPTTAAIP